MDRIIELLSKALPQDQITEAELNNVANELVESVRAELEQEFDAKLEEAYAELAQELKQAEQTATQGYQEAYAVIEDLRNRLETQRVEFETSLDEGYEEAYQMLLGERAKNEQIEVDLYDRMNSDHEQMKEWFIDKLDEFLQFKGTEIYENARRDIMSDPRMAERSVVLDRIVDQVSDYISDDDYSAVTNSKIEEVRKAAEDLKGQIRILEARNIRLSTDNNKLQEQVRQGAQLIEESKQHQKVEQKQERTQKASNVQGRGQIVTEAVIPEHQESATEKTDDRDMTLVEGMDPDFLRQMQVLSGVKSED